MIDTTRCIMKLTLGNHLVLGSIFLGLTSLVHAEEASYFATATFSTKSFILPITPDQLGFENESKGKQKEALYLAEFTNQSANSNPVTPDESQKDFRLWSSKRFTLQCRGNKVVQFFSEKTAFSIGPEIIPYVEVSIQPTHGEVVYDRAFVSNDGKVHFDLKTRARPPGTSDLLFNAVRKRSSVYIWQHLSGTLECAPDTVKGYRFNLSFDASQFPSHRVWVDDTVIDWRNQGTFEELWQSSPLNAEEIE